jgi:hypothetical protein
MSRMPSRLSWQRLPRFAWPIACLMLAAAPAHAGLGDMMKKAQDKALKSAEQKVTKAPPDSCKKPQFDAVTVELTDERIDRILATFKAAGEAGTGRPALVEKLNQANEEQRTLMDKHGEEMSAARSKRSDVESCYHDGYRAVTNRKMEEYKTRALSDPALLQKYTKLAQENNALIAKGDTAALQRAQAGMLEEMIPTREESLKVRNDCGPIPPKSAAEQRLEALDKEITALNDSIAKVDEKVAKAQAKQGGMDPQQWAMALERIQMYLSAKKSGSSKTRICWLTDAEIAAIEKRLEPLRAVLG